MKLICVPTHYYWSISFSAVNSILYKFFTCMSDICSWSTNYTFLQVLPSKDFITIWVTKWGQFLWVVNSISRLHLWIHICVVPFEGPLHLSLQSHICLTLDDGGPLHLWIHIPVLPFEGPPISTLVSYMSHLTWWGVIPHLWIHKCVLTFKGPLHLWLQSHICLTLDYGESTPSLDPSPVLFIPVLFALYWHKPYIFIFQVQFW